MSDKPKPLSAANSETVDAARLRGERDEALETARAIWHDCLDRRGIKWECEKVDDEVRDGEILPAWASLILYIPLAEYPYERRKDTMTPEERSAEIKRLKAIQEAERDDVGSIGRLKNRMVQAQIDKLEAAESEEQQKVPGFGVVDKDEAQAGDCPMREALEELAFALHDDDRGLDMSKVTVALNSTCACAESKCAMCWHPISLHNSDPEDHECSMCDLEAGYEKLRQELEMVGKETAEVLASAGSMVMALTAGLDEQIQRAESLQEALFSEIEDAGEIEAERDRLRAELDETRARLEKRMVEFRQMEESIQDFDAELNNARRANAVLRAKLYQKQDSHERDRQHAMQMHHKLCEYENAGGGGKYTKLQAENERLRTAVLNQCGDNLCWVENVDQAKALPEAEFLESCRRYRDQIAGERGELQAGQMTIAQLEATIEKERAASRDTIQHEREKHRQDTFAKQGIIEDLRGELVERTAELALVTTIVDELNLDYADLNGELAASQERERVLSTHLRYVLETGMLSRSTMEFQESIAAALAKSGDNT
jgi:hypothetical protein